MTANAVRQLVRNAVAEQGLDADSCIESILLRNREYAGRRFCFEGRFAVWLAGADEVRLYDEAGQHTTTLPLDEHPQVERKAA